MLLSLFVTYFAVVSCGLTGAQTEGPQVTDVEVNNPSAVEAIPPEAPTTKIPPSEVPLKVLEDVQIFRQPPYFPGALPLALAPHRFAQYPLFLEVPIPFPLFRRLPLPTELIDHPRPYTISLMLPAGKNGNKSSPKQRLFKLRQSVEIRRPYKAEVNVQERETTPISDVTTEKPQPQS